MSRPHLRDAGFTLVELLMTVTILGVIIVPLGDFLVSYLNSYQQTESRVSDSHDIQIAAAYMSNDVASVGLRTSASDPAFQQSVWTGPFPASYCGQGTGATILLLSWNAYSVAGSGQGTLTNTSSVAYTNVAGTLHRVYCATGTAGASDAVLVHGLQSVSVSCSSSCNATTPPSTITLTIGVSTGAGDTSATSVALTGRRRES